MSDILEKVTTFTKNIRLKNVIKQLSILLLIGGLLFLIVFAIHTQNRYTQIKNLIELESFENFENIGDEDANSIKKKEDLMKKLKIDKTDMDMIKNKKYEKMPITEKPSRIDVVQSEDIYDEFYSKMYDMVAYDTPKVLYEYKYIQGLIKKLNIDNNNVEILDVGCGTGQHGKLLSKDYKYTGVDRSKHMLKIAKDKIDVSGKLILQDANKLTAVGEDSYNIILCLYFTIYYFKDLDKIFSNLTRWIKDDGYLVLHLVDRELFDPVLNPANPSPLNSIQKYSKKRITNSVINFNNITYISDFVLKKNNMAEFQELIRFKDTNVERRQSHLLYMYTNKHFVNVAKKYGFMLEEIKNLENVKFEHNYLFVFKKVRKD